MTRVPFRLAGGRNPLILLPVLVNDAGPYQFILDTGASHTLITPPLAESLGIRAEHEDAAMGAGGTITIGHSHADSLTLGSVRREHVPVGITGELEQIGAAIKAPVDGNLGHDFLWHLVLTLDYQSCTLIIGESATTGVPFRLASPDKPLILVPVFANGRGPFQFVVDTGASRTCISDRVATQLGTTATESARGLGGGGGIAIARATLASLSIGDATVHDHAVGVVTFLDTLAEHVGTPLDGIVGYNFLNQFRPTIDYPRSTLTL